jgi:methylmalonyl-CoA mutase
MVADDSTFTRLPSPSELFDGPSIDRWREIGEASLKGKPIEKLSARTHEGLTIPPLFTADDTAPDPGFPGQAPHTRGRTALGAGPRGWTICQAVTHADPEVAARWAAEDRRRGVEAVWLIFDTSVRLAGLDVDPVVGDGVRIDDSRGFDPFFDRLDLTTQSLHLSAGGNTPAVAAALLAAARRHEVGPHELRGSLGFDPLGALAADGTLTAGLRGSFALMAELAAWTHQRAPDLRSVAVSTIAYHLAGASAVEELAYALATAVDYLRALTDRGIDVGAASRQILFRHAIGRDLFMEAAKLRACRRLWSRAAGACGVDGDDRAAMIHAVASPRGLTTRDPWVNMLRTTVGSFAAVVGGADLVTVLPFDSAIGPPEELGRRMAANSQTILREESHLARVVDPGGGSWYVESLTDNLSRSAWKRFQEIEQDGGMAAALTNGTVAAELERLRVRREGDIATGRDPITGVSSYPNLAEEALERTPAAPPRPTEPAAATEELARLFTIANDSPGDGSALDSALTAAAADAGIGGLAAALRGTREPTTIAPLPSRRDAADFEGLRDASDTWLARHGSRPRIFLANMGPIPEHKPRATFAKHFFEAAGIETVSNDGFASVDEAVGAFADADTQMAVICSSDARYPDLVPGLASALEERGARTVLVAGRPGEHETGWRSAGVTGFVHLGCDQYGMLVDLLREEGVLHV